MNKEEVAKFITLFDEIKNQEAPKSKKDGIEFWFARDLQKVLDYEEWRNFNLVINKAKKSCEASKHNIEDHFVDANKKAAIGLNKGRSIDDTMLTFEIPGFIDAETWNDYLKMRIKAKAPNTDRAINLIINDLTEFENRKAGNANIALNNSIKNNWKGVFEPKSSTNYQSPLGWLNK